jgi:SAM-dependent methyltransferase
MPAGQLDNKSAFLMELGDQMSVTAQLCYQLSRRLILRRQDKDVEGRKTSAAADSTADASAFDRSAYQDFRKSELEEQFTRHFSTDLVKDKDVLDFGCGGGELSFFLATQSVNSIRGTEVSEEQLELAKIQAAEQTLPVEPSFHLCEDTAKIDEPDNSYDVLLCFDVLEHILDYETIIPEWWRILRDDGVILVWWMPYYHPYGHHVYSLVPLPWIHTVFSDQTIIDACAKVYDMPEYSPRLWDLDEAGNKKPNRWNTLKELPTLNKLSISRFERMCSELGFVFDRREYCPMASSGLANTISSAMVKLPYMNEFFSSCVIYEIRKPAQTRKAGVTT